MMHDFNEPGRKIITAGFIPPMNPIRSPGWVHIPDEPKRNISKDLVKFYLLIQLSDFPTHRPDSHWCSKSGSPSVPRTTTDGS